MEVKWVDVNSRRARAGQAALPTAGEAKVTVDVALSLPDRLYGTVLYLRGSKVLGIAHG
jgi:hypothetical protein